MLDVPLLIAPLSKATAPVDVFFTTKPILPFEAGVNEKMTESWLLATIGGFKCQVRGAITVRVFVAPGVSAQRFLVTSSLAATR